MPARADKQLPQVLLAKSEVQAEPQHQERPDSLGGGPRIAILIRHALEDLVGHLAVFGKRAVRLEHAHNRLERIPVDPHHPLDFL